MRICHMWKGAGKINFGIYACSPEDSSFKATFTNLSFGECKWLSHEGQKPANEVDEMNRKNEGKFRIRNSERRRGGRIMNYELKGILREG